MLSTKDARVASTKTVTVTLLDIRGPFQSPWETEFRGFRVRQRSEELSGIRGIVSLKLS